LKSILLDELFPHILPLSERHCPERASLQDDGSKTNWKCIYYKTASNCDTSDYTFVAGDFDGDGKDEIAYCDRASLSIFRYVGEGFVLETEGK